MPLQSDSVRSIVASLPLSRISSLPSCASRVVLDGIHISTVQSLPASAYALKMESPKARHSLNNHYFTQYCRVAHPNSHSHPEVWWSGCLESLNPICVFIIKEIRDPTLPIVSWRPPCVCMRPFLKTTRDHNKRLIITQRPLKT